MVAFQSPHIYRQPLTISCNRRHLTAIIPSCCGSGFITALGLAIATNLNPGLSVITNLGTLRCSKLPLSMNRGTLSTFAFLVANNRGTLSTFSFLVANNRGTLSTFAFLATDNLGTLFTFKFRGTNNRGTLSTFKFRGINSRDNPHPCEPLVTTKHAASLSLINRQGNNPAYRCNSAVPIIVSKGRTYCRNPALGYASITGLISFHFN